MKTLGKFFRLTETILAGFIGLGLFPALSLATVINDCPGGVCSLQDLLNGSTITINDKQFDSWQFFNQATSLGQLPDYSLISVNPIDNPLNPGLSFSTNGQMSITNGVAGDFVYFDFGYRVQTVDNVPRIEDNSQQLGSYNLSGAGGSVGISQTVCQGGFFCPLSSSDLVSLTNVFADNTIPAVNLFDSASFLPQTELFVENQVSAFNSFDGESVALNGFEQRFSQVPEPSSFALLGLGLIGFLPMRRWQTLIRNRKECLRSRADGSVRCFVTHALHGFGRRAPLCGADTPNFNLDRGTIMQRFHAISHFIGNLVEKPTSWIGKSRSIQTSYINVSSG